MRKKKPGNKRARESEGLRRKRGDRLEYEKILILCEGRETEPNYLNAFCKDHNLGSVTVAHCSSRTDPVAIVKEALERYEKDDYNRMYCVFDKEHGNHQKALDLVAKKYKENIPIYTIVSMPCFEFWFLCHFIKTTSPFGNKSNKSRGDQIKSVLEEYIPGYRDAHKGIYKATKHLLDKAIDIAKDVNKQQAEAGTDNPSTNVHELIEYLRELKA